MFFLEAKELKATDLSFFEWHFHNPTLWGGRAGKQKAVNPSKRLIEANFPAIASPPGWPDAYTPPAAWPSGGPNFRVNTTIYGPGLSGPDTTRKATLSLAQKNWRINGLHHNPRTTPTRYNSLREGDWVVIGLSGNAVRPTVLTLVFLDGKVSGSDDAKLIAGLAGKGAKTGKTLPVEELEAIVKAAAPAPAHGIHTLLTGNFQAIALGGAPAPPAGTRRIDGHVYPGRMTPAGLAASKKAQEKAGRMGEELVNAYLTKQVIKGLLPGYEWRSTMIADSPYDFVLDPAGTPERMDVKATSGSFDNEFYISVNELLAMLEGVAYRIYRVFSMDANAKTGHVRISGDLSGFASTAKAALQALPAGLEVTTLSLIPAGLSGVSWSPPVKLKV